MRRTFIAALAIFGTIGSGFAADFAGPKTPAPASARFDWSGLYLGAHLGGSWSTSSYNHVETTPPGTNEAFSVTPSSIAGGLQIGVLKQFDNFVVGAEAKYTFRNGEASAHTDLAGFPRDRYTINHDVFSVTSKFGWAQDRWLGYGKLGAAFTDLSYANKLSATGAVLGESRRNVAGLLLGVGAEYAVLSNVTVGAEYEYAHYYVGNQQQMSGGLPVAAYNANNKFASHTLSLRANYKFDLFK